ncbi:MAG: cyclopropane-fatty-acyl-phospholipid synthase family protein [Acidobacteriota bacterium]
MATRMEPDAGGAELAHASSLLQLLFEDYHPRDFDVRFWDGSTWAAEGGGAPKFTLVLNHPSAVQSMMSPPLDLAMGEAYIHQKLDVEGDLESVFHAADHLLIRKWKPADRVRLGWQLSRLQTPDSGSARPAELPGLKHSEGRDQAAVTSHYDLSNEFFSLWLDPSMVYSCAFFSSPAQHLIGAQWNKLDLVCRKLKLRPDEAFLDVGCGWGALAIHAATIYGARVTGITLSEPQAQLARERARRAGLSEERCQIRVLDYRAMDQPAAFDKIASIGMVEHVGESQLPVYFEHIHRLLKPGGLFLNHGISANRSRLGFIHREFLNRYVFPDAEMTPLDTVLGHAEQVGFEVRNVESLREHYTLTLRAWGHNLDQAKEKACRLVGEVNFRIWKLFMAAAAYSFEKGNHSIFQSLLLKEPS